MVQPLLGALSHRLRGVHILRAEQQHQCAHESCNGESASKGDLAHYVRPQHCPRWGAPPPYTFWFHLGLLHTILDERLGIFESSILSVFRIQIHIQIQIHQQVFFRFEFFAFQEGTQLKPVQFDCYSHHR